MKSSSDFTIPDGETLESYTHGRPELVPSK